MKAPALPEMLRPFFWEYNFKDLSWEEDRELIIYRLLDRGSWEALKWLRTQVTNQELQEWLVRRRGAGLSPRCLRYWELVLDIPPREVDGWLAQEGRKIWDDRLGA